MSRMDDVFKKSCEVFGVNPQDISNEKREEIPNFLLDTYWSAWEMLCEMCSQEEECKKPTEQSNAENT